MVYKNPIMYIMDEISELLVNPIKLPDNLHQSESDNEGGVIVENTDLCLLNMDYGYCKYCRRNLHFIKCHIGAFHRDKKERRCLICGQLFLKKGKLFRHLLNHENNETRCVYCSKSGFNDFEELLTHLEEHWYLHIYQCGICSKSFSIKSNFEEHILAHSRTWRRVSLDCLKCDRQFESHRGGMKNLKSHYEDEHKNKLKCDKCHKKFSKFVMFYNHCMRHINKLPFNCDKCGLGFRKYCLLRDHMDVVHLNLFNYTCSQCDKKFKHKPSFDAHLRWHDKSLRFTCNYCAKLFLRKVSLLDHFTEKACSVCDMEFHCVTTFKGHFEMFHSTDNLFSCDECDKTYKFENGLKRHKTLEHPTKGQNIFKCQICIYETTTRHNLNRHKRRNHKQ